MSADGVFNNPGELNGLTAHDKDGTKIGSVGQVYVDDRTGRPEWVTVKTGMFGMKESLVPLDGARRSGEDLHFPHSKETVKEAPRLDADEHLDASQEKQLYQHYGLTNTTGTGMGTPMATGTAGITGAGTAATSGGAAGAGTGADARFGRGAPAGEAARPPRTTADSPATAGMRKEPAMRGSEEFTGREMGEELIRSEEQLRVTTEEHEAGHARLHKIVVTENVTTTVPLTHEEVRVIHEPIAPEDRAMARDSRIGEAETEVTLHAEQPVIRKESIPVERVRMETEKVTEQKEVSSDVRKEQIEYDSGEGDTGMGGKRGPGH
ncbi:PRC and DUF2382 domain-containing protein [Streptomyces sp. NPDC088725]|uniref:PRC and DUF2382 domain-containing protein n=1 Tax=Streptomyces sp. NPDC088725 TaxID=3365873 RepID=UPI003830E69B